MSTRTYMLALQSLAPIRDAVGSQNQKLLDALSDALGSDREFQGYARDMIMNPRPAKEPGCWNYLIEPLAKHLGLSPRHLPLDDWKHYYVWEDYRSAAAPLISVNAQQMLRLMEAGRPFHGSEIDHDGCTFAWLTSEETESLLKELSGIEVDELDELDEFHEELTECLQEAVEGKSAVFLGAH